MSGSDELPMEAYLAALAGLPEIGPGTLRRLLRLGEPAEVWQRVATGRVPESVVAVPPGGGSSRGGRAAGAGATTGPATGRRALTSAEVLGGWRSHCVVSSPEKVWEECHRAGVGVTSIGSPGYPPALADDISPPVVIFHRGRPDVLAARRVAVVGTRRATGYGRRVAAELGSALAAQGVCVVSGMALGVDVAAHAGALGSGGAGPAAVVASGPDDPGPVRNRRVADAVAERGVVLSEVPPGVKPFPWRFPVRNRILAALAEAVVVVESAVTGGSMHTVREALRRDRPVIAVPGPIDSAASAGTNQLIAEGALVCRDVEDITCAIGLTAGAGTDRAGSWGSADPRPVPSGPAAAVLDALDWRPATVEHLAAMTGLGLDELVTALGGLERSGWVVRRGGWVERVARPPVPGVGDPPHPAGLPTGAVPGPLRAP